MGKFAVRSYYKHLSGCAGTLDDSIEGATLKDIDTTGWSTSVLQDGRLFYLSFAPPPNSLNKNGAFIGTPELFFRAQNFSVDEKPVIQVKQTFNAIYGGMYGGGIGRIVVTGITKIWSRGGGASFTANHPDAPNWEIENLYSLLQSMINTPGAIFNVHDGTRARKWPVIPSGFNTVESVNHHNQATYQATFLCASFGQDFRHIETAGENLKRFGGPTAKFQSRNIV